MSPQNNLPHFLLAFFYYCKTNIICNRGNLWTQFKLSPKQTCSPSSPSSSPPCSLPLLPPSRPGTRLLRLPPPTVPLCCASVVDSSSAAASGVAGVLGLDLTGLNVPVGLSCSAITVVGNNCGSTSVTCDAPEKEWGGLLAINCLPITL
ncbi:hypothetical protein B0H14DRAFT_3853012 [Mycena olivaceomarginata]|nr:hypothetical protein B0H14DRAFT_3853012 [Mycena olivaceomarginata]